MDYTATPTTAKTQLCWHKMKPCTCKIQRKPHRQDNPHSAFQRRIHVNKDWTRIQPRVKISAWSLTPPSFYCCLALHVLNFDYIQRSPSPLTRQAEIYESSRFLLSHNSPSSWHATSTHAHVTSASVHVTRTIAIVVPVRIERLELVHAERCTPHRATATHATHDTHGTVPTCSPPPCHCHCH